MEIKEILKIGKFPRNKGEMQIGGDVLDCRADGFIQFVWAKLSPSITINFLSLGEPLEIEREWS